MGSLRGQKNNGRAVKYQPIISIRTCPLNETSKCAVSMDDHQCVIEYKKELKPLQVFRFDHCFESTTTSNNEAHINNEEVFDSVGSSMMRDVFRGYHVSFMTYGQKGSGKTHTLFGNNLKTAQPPAEHQIIEKGFIQHYLETLLNRANQLQEKQNKKLVPNDIRDYLTIEVAAAELYFNKAYDLLGDKIGERQIREHKLHGPFIDNLTTMVIEHGEDINLILEQIQENRHENRSKMPSRGTYKSSKGHLFCYVYVTYRKPIPDPYDQLNTLNQGTMGSSIRNTRSLQASINRREIINNDSTSTHFNYYRSRTEFVDLASSSRGLKKAKPQDIIIQHGLASIVKCIEGRARNRPVVPYRDNNLSFLLRNAFTNNRFYVLGCIRPESDYYDTTFHTLSYLRKLYSGKYTAVRRSVSLASILEPIHTSMNTTQLLRQSDYPGLTPTPTSPDQYLQSSFHSLPIAKDKSKASTKLLVSISNAEQHELNDSLGIDTSNNFVGSFSSASHIRSRSPQTGRLHHSPPSPSRKRTPLYVPSSPLTQSSSFQSSFTVTSPLLDYHKSPSTPSMDMMNTLLSENAALRYKLEALESSII